MIVHILSLIVILILLIIFISIYIIYKKNILGFPYCYNLTNKNSPPDNNFNPGIIIYENNKYTNIITTNNYNCKVVFRNEEYKLSYNSKIYECNFDINKYNLYDIKLKYDINNGYEDPRLFAFNNKLYISMTKINKNVFIPKVVVVDYDNNIEYNFPYLNNIKGINHPEKNWQFFQYLNKYYLLYSIFPLIIYEIDKNFNIIKKIKETIWKHKYVENLRCSAPPIFINGVFYCIVHSFDVKKLYNTYFITFNENFDILGYTLYPLYNNNKYNIIFSTGFIYNKLNNNFIILSGIEDKYINLVKVNKRLLYIQLNFINKFYI
jgi:hypothetical protein